MLKHLIFILRHKILGLQCDKMYCADQLVISFQWALWKWPVLYNGLRLATKAARDLSSLIWVRITKE